MAKFLLLVFLALQISACDSLLRAHARRLVRGGRASPMLQRGLGLRVSTPSDGPAEEPAPGFPRRTRFTLAAIAGVGFAETAYLTVQKVFFGAANICGTRGCQEVLSGPFSSVAGIPLTLPGSLAYASVALLALVPLYLMREGEGGEVAREAQVVDTYSRMALVAVTTSMAVFSGYLMLVLALVIGSPCPYCITSAVLSTSLAAITWRSNLLGSRRQGLALGGASGVATALLSLGLFLNVQGAEASNAYLMGEEAKSVREALSPAEQKAQEKLEMLEEAEIDAALLAKRAPRVLVSSSPRALKLADHLASIDAKMYGAYWCGHCYSMKQVLGKEAMKKITYIECGKDAVDTQRKLCTDAKVPGYPTWEINGELYPGEKTLAELEDISGLMEPKK